MREEGKAISTAQGVVLVTGATGTVGREVVRMLADAGEPVRGAVPAPEQVRDRDRAAVPYVRFDFGDQTTWGRALDGVDRLFLLRPPAIADTKTYIRPIIQLCARRGLAHVTFLSLLGANPAMPHWRIERDILAARLPYTFLRAAFFMQNLDTAYREDIRDRNRIRLPAGQGRTSFVDVRDIAEVAALSLRNPQDYRNRVFSLTGAEPFDYGTVTSVLSATLGRPIVYQPISLLRYWRELRAAGAGRNYAFVLLAIQLAARLGLAARIAPDLAQLLGHPPRRLADYVRDYRQAWLPGTER